MTFWDFAHGHPIVTLLGLWFVTSVFEAAVKNVCIAHVRSKEEERENLRRKRNHETQ